MEMTKAFSLGFLKEAVAGCGAGAPGAANANPIALAEILRRLKKAPAKTASEKIPFEVLRGAKTLGSMVRKMPVLSQIHMRQALMKNLMSQVTATPEGTRYALNSIGRRGGR